ncbi:hypothetical protein BDU57DRAFT_489898 [Ampelomyces quisqualis]|uniref:Uncharacterized protein n=1 Tax=Ampelomyces quisqualis TaxID=50730 RepID=A0A6A5R3M9_AMPQU|nr:hypothetical protein BDU57DRAFT_489898 [Ampelomyces quisqualis]
MQSPAAPWGSPRTPSPRPASRTSSSRTTEQTPLLARDDRSDHAQQEAPRSPATASLLRTLSGSSSKPFWKTRWPSILALAVLCVAVVAILLGFLAAEGIDEYAMQAADFRPTRLALDGLAAQGARVRIEGDFTMDASKVNRQGVRNIGRLGTWIAREAETGPFDAHLSLPEYGNVLVGTAHIPSIKVNIRNGHTTHISLVASVKPGSPDGIRNVANDYIDGRLGQIRVQGTAEVPVRSGLINVGKHLVEQSMVFNGGDMPALPHYNITKLNIREANKGRKGMGADASIVVVNDFPVEITLPPVGVDVLIDGCSSDKQVFVGTAETADIVVKPKTDIQVNVTGNVEHLSDSLTEVCPKSAKSPLDAFIGEYIKGEDATIYINCCTFPDPNTPDWARDLLKDITVPVPFTGKEMGNMVKNFTMANMHFSLPDPFAEPGTPEASPKISAVVNVDVGLPAEMNFPLDVNQIKADADIFYKGKKLGNMDLRKWQKANSTRLDAHGKEGPSLLVQSEIKNAPIEILDDDLFSQVVQALLFGGGKPIMLDMKALVSIGVDTPMGKFAIRGIPAKGTVPVKPPHHEGGNDLKSRMAALNIRVGNLSIIGTTPTSITMQVYVNMTNPSNYSATVPYLSINILVNGTVLGQALIKDMHVKPGNNTNLIATALWDPFTNSGLKGRAVGSEMLSQYISGFNTSVTLQAHNGTIPAQPGLSHLMSKYPITLPAPHLSQPKPPTDGDGDGDDDGDDKGDEKDHFIQSTTMHLISSTATFTLNSPFHSTTMFITHLNATAYYKDDPAGQILYDLPFAVPPGLSESPRIPVHWTLGGIGYDAVRNALGGHLKLAAFAHVGFRIGEWHERIWFRGGQIGANIRL